MENRIRKAIEDLQEVLKKYQELDRQADCTDRLNNIYYQIRALVNVLEGENPSDMWEQSYKEDIEGLKKR